MSVEVIPDLELTDRPKPIDEFRGFINLAGRAEVNIRQARRQGSNTTNAHPAARKR
jgi:hypothetical protein